MKRLMNRFSSSIKTKITALLLVISIVPLVIQAVIVTKESTESLRQDAEELQSDVADWNADVINNWFTQKINFLTNLIEAHPEFMSGKKQDVMPTLKLLGQTDKEVLRYAYGEPNGISYDTTDRMLDIKDQDHFKIIQETKSVYISDVFQDMESGENILVVDVPLFNDGGEFRGVIQAILDPTKILELVDEIKIGESGYGYIVSPQGKILIHPDQSNIGKDLNEVVKDAAPLREQVLSKDVGFLTHKDETMAFNKISVADWNLLTVAPESEVFAKVDAARNSAIIILSISVIIVAVVAYVFAKYVIRQITDIIQVMNKVEKGDLTERLMIKGKDEIADVKRNINRMLESFAGMVRKVTGATNQIVTSSEKLTEISNESTLAAERNSKSVMSVLNGSEMQLQTSEQTSKATEEMAMGISRIADSAARVSEHAYSVTEEVNHGNEDTRLAVSQMNVVSKAVEESAEMIRSLKDKSEEVHNIVSVISDVANKTNLLALNASIEAARAGEHGKGFSIVADEVMKLAIQTSKSTVDISKIIDDIIVSTDKASKSMENGLDEVTKGLDQVHNVGQVFDSIAEAFEEVNNQVQEVSAASEEISAGTEEVSASSHEVANISRQTLDEMNEVTQDINHQHQSMENMLDFSESLKAMAFELREMIAQYQVNEKSIDEQTE